MMFFHQTSLTFLFFKIRELRLSEIFYPVLIRSFPVSFVSNSIPCGRVVQMDFGEIRPYLSAVLGRSMGDFVTIDPRNERIGIRAFQNIKNYLNRESIGRATIF